jgi:hypothetical protein
MDRHRLALLLQLNTQLPVEETMQNNERCQELSVQATNEQNAQTLSKLIEEIASLLQERNARLRTTRSEVVTH